MADQDDTKQLLERVERRLAEMQAAREGVRRRALSIAERRAAARKKIAAGQGHELPRRRMTRPVEEGE